MSDICLHKVNLLARAAPPSGYAPASHDAAFTVDVRAGHYSPSLSDFRAHTLLNFCAFREQIGRLRPKCNSSLKGLVPTLRQKRLLVPWVLIPAYAHCLLHDGQILNTHFVS